VTVALIKIGGSIVLLVGTLTMAKFIGGKAGLNAETQRKLIHTGLGLYALTFPLLFNEAWEVATLCGIAALFFVAVRVVPAMKRSVGSGLHGVERFSLGELFFAFSIGLVFTLADGNVVLYIVPMAILALSDAAAALVGVGYGRNIFAIEKGTKSVEGTVVFFLTAWLIALIAILLLSDADRVTVVAVSFIVAVVGALVEAISWKGLDNLFVPIGLYLLLERSLSISLDELAIMMMVFMTALIIALIAGRTLGQSKHVFTTGVTALLFFWLVGDWANLVAPTATFTLYLVYKFAAGNQEDRDTDLAFTLSLITTAVAWYAISEVFTYNTAYVFNISYGVHMVVLAVLHHKPAWVGSILGAIVVAAAAMSVRILFVAEPSPDNLPLFIGAVMIVALMTGVVMVLRNFYTTERWSKQTVTALCGGAIGVLFKAAL
jgi:dolichol kinase